MDTSKYSIAKPSKIIAVIIYILMIFIGTTVFSILMAMLVASTRGMDANLVADSFWNKDVITNEIKECQVIGQGWGNFIAYLLAFAGIVFYTRDEFVKDFKKILQDKKWHFIIIPAFAIGFAGLACLLDYLFSFLSPASNNQSTIVEILKSDARIPMIISTVIFAPIVEEMIYRKIIFKVTQDFSLPLAYVFSVLLFALPHMLSTSSSVGVWFIQLCPYVICGALLCMIYHLSNYNVYASTLAHALNNILSVVFL